ncbi:alkB, alkylation repair protein 6 [Pyrenophora tritici-repentis Pt-1C-BFP]|uniref:AlkB, alkylation repair protein 6 n=3 Tax=Pyrenophora tritici-repentis TaxID=45151 RepID=B2VRL7_PYRTR|nr:alkB, alkylation repair protein 6 [Pyrenophora tritici-repentis Pt-1C-BFP]EDU39620.1 alkB, alkylation repair protein 6 [Pyrenophora tritici-repentis Pt-1C-BFP]
MINSDMSAEKKGLEAFHIAGLPPDFYYIPNFISVEEEISILQKIPANRWTHLTHRRLQAIPSTLTKSNTLLAAPLPNYLTNPIVKRFEDYGIFAHTPHQQPNHVLVNEYKAGEGIMPHEDGDAYADVVATVSLGAALCLDVLPPRDGDEGEYSLPTRIFQEPRSLLITTGRAYRELMHGISSVEVDEELGEESVANWGLLGDREVLLQEGGRNMRGTRVSLTYRDVLKVSTAASKILCGLVKR